jgi:hypothetical protein
MGMSDLQRQQAPSPLSLACLHDQVGPECTNAGDADARLGRAVRGSQAYVASAARDEREKRLQPNIIWG